MDLKSGIHIVFEGPDSVGKSTQIKAVKKHLEDRNIEVVLTREPGGTRVGSMLRTILLDTDVEIDPRAEALMMAADRAQDVAQIIKPACESGNVVLSDRYIPSSLVYQGVVRGLGVDDVLKLSQFAVGDHEPDLVLCFELADELADMRAGDQPDRIEQEGSIFAQKIRDAYRSLCSQQGWSIVDANGTTDEVFSRIVDLINPLLDSKIS